MVPKDGVRGGGRHLCKPPSVGSAQPGPCCRHGAKPWGHAILWAGQRARPPCTCIKRVGCVESRGAVLSAAGGGRSPVGCPAQGLADFAVTGAPLGVPPCPAPTGAGCHAEVCGEGASMAGSVPAAAPALGLPFFGGWGEVNESSRPPAADKSCLSPAPTAAAMASPGTQLALFYPGRHRAPAPGRPPPFPGAWSLLEPVYRVLRLPVPMRPWRVSRGERGGRILSRCCCLSRGKQEESRLLQRSGK